MVDLFAWQLVLVPPFFHSQFQVHGPFPVMVDGVPLVQRFVGGYESVLLLSLQHTPLIGVGGGVSSQVFTWVICQLPSTASDETQNQNSVWPSFAFQDSGLIVKVILFFVFLADQRLISEARSKDIFQLVIGVLVRVFLRVIFRQYPVFQSLATVDMRESQSLLIFIVVGRIDEGGGVIMISPPETSRFVGRPLPLAQYPTLILLPAGIFVFQDAGFTRYLPSLIVCVPPHKLVIVEFCNEKENSDQVVSVFPVFLRDTFSQNPLPQSEVLDCDISIPPAKTVEPDIIHRMNIQRSLKCISKNYMK